MIYGILSTIAFLIALPFWLISGLFIPKLIYGFKEKLGYKYNFKKEKTGKIIIFYGVSVGEVIAMENLIKRTRDSFPTINIIVMTGTKTGQEIAQNKLANIVDLITYFPFDFPFCIKNMIKKLKPDAIFVMETELWPNFAHITNKKQIPTYIINARISDRTYKSYKKLKYIFEPILKKYKSIYPQSKQDYNKFISLGAKPDKTEIMGNLKFDINQPETNNLNFSKNPEHKIILAGSTHFGEEDIIIKSFYELQKEIPKLKLLIAPRHLQAKYNFNCGFRSKNDTFENNDIVLLDTMGELSKFYSISDVVFMGGSFPVAGGDNFGKKGVGGHNPLEATIFKKPVVSGPSIHNFKDIFAILNSANCAKIVNTEKELTQALKKLLTDENYYQMISKDCEKVFEQNKGATQFVLKVLQTIV